MQGNLNQFESNDFNNSNFQSFYQMYFGDLFSFICEITPILDPIKGIFVDLRAIDLDY